MRFLASLSATLLLLASINVLAAPVYLNNRENTSDVLGTTFAGGSNLTSNTLNFANATVNSIYNVTYDGTKFLDKQTNKIVPIARQGDETTMTLVWNGSQLLDREGGRAYSILTG